MTTTATEPQSSLGPMRERALDLIRDLNEAAGDEGGVIAALRPHFENSKDFLDLALSALIVTFAECVIPVDQHDQYEITDVPDHSN